ncbi:MAG: hypothetical protein ACOZIN_13495 [Myxococcota bacterium]
MSPELLRPLGFFAATVAVGASAIVLFPRLFGAAAGPEVEIITSLKRTERTGLTQGVNGSPTPLRSRRHQFDRLQVSAARGAKKATLTATLDFTGSFGDTEVSSLGLERVELEGDDEWSPVGGWAPRLAAAVAMLERRRQALEAGDLESLAVLGQKMTAPLLAAHPEVQRLLTVRGRKYRARAWYLRSEREEVTVREEYQLVGSLPDRPVDELGARRLTLVWQNGEFFFAQGLM